MYRLLLALTLVLATSGGPVLSQQPVPDLDTKAQVRELIDVSFERQLQGDYQGALEVLDQAAALEPKNGYVLDRRAYALLALGNKAGAIADAQHSAELCLAQGDLKCQANSLRLVDSLRHEKNLKPSPELMELMRVERERLETRSQ